MPINSNPDAGIHALSTNLRLLRGRLRAPLRQVLRDRFRGILSLSRVAFRRVYILPNRELNRATGRV